MKGIPAYIHLLIAYFVLPSLLPFSLSAYTCAIIALGCCSSGYCTTIITAGIAQIPQGIWKACFALGYSPYMTWSRIIAPLLSRIVFAPLQNEVEQLLKSTALVATLGITDITRAGMNTIARTLQPIPVYCIVACTYLIISLLFTCGATALRKRFFVYDIS
jgi:polar amino acid transport system permease protein